MKDGANNLGSVAVEYTYQNGTGNRTTELVSNYKNVVTPTTGSAANVEYTYTYDANGNILSDSVGGTLMHTYVYDEAGQLVRVNDAVQNNTFCYTYDNGGNLVYKKRYAYTTGALGPALQTSTYAYGDSNWKDKLTAYNGIPLTYDAMGNLTEFEGINFTWTAGRQLKQYEFNNGISDLVVDYKYNADGLRTQKKVTDNENFYSVTYDYIWADGKLVSRTDGTDVLYFIYDSNNSPIGVILNDSATYLYIKNLQGDVTGIADENGNIIVNYSYDEWGRLLSMTGSGAGTIGLTNPLRYSGYYYDAETGYYYLQSRYYSPYWGRFLNADYYVDTEKDSFGTNMFAYCENNSINYIDPNGFFGKDFHYYETKKIAIDALFKEDYAEAIAFGCNDVDKKFPPVHLSSYVQSWHFNINMKWDSKTSKMIIDPTLPDSRDLRGADAMKIAKEYLLKANSYNAYPKLRKTELISAFEWFGAFLHTQQDKIAHSGKYGNMAMTVGKHKILFFYHSSLPNHKIDDMNRKYLDSEYATGDVATFITALEMVKFKLSIKYDFPIIYKEILRK